MIALAGSKAMRIHSAKNCTRCSVSPRACASMVALAFFCCERLSASMARSLHLSFICIPRSTRALDQGGAEPRQAVSPRPGGQGRYRFATASAASMVALAMSGVRLFRRYFFVASAFRPVWPGRCDLSFICIPQSTRALDQGGVEPRQAVSPKALRPWTIPLRYSVG